MKERPAFGRLFATTRFLERNGRKSRLRRKTAFNRAGTQSRARLPACCGGVQTNATTVRLFEKNTEISVHSTRRLDFIRVHLCPLFTVLFIAHLWLTRHKMK